MAERYNRIQEGPHPELYVPSCTDALYFYGRSFFLKDLPIRHQHQKATEFFLGQSRKFWLKTNMRQTQGHLALAHKRWGGNENLETAKGIMASIKERSVTSEEMGMFWRDLELSWWWYHAPIETQALMIEAFDEITQDAKAVEECKVWLLNQKQTQDWKTTFNAGATRLEDGTTLLLCRVEDRRGHSHLCAARSRNGIDGWVVDPQPTLWPDPENIPEELWGIEDPRITYVVELGKYVVAYTAFSRGGPGVALAVTEDFVTFERYGLVMQPDDKDAALLPHRIDGNFALVHRPMTDTGAHIWISFSPDLHNWGGHKILLQTRRGSWWDANKVGLSPPLIETERAWLMLYHGVRQTASGCLYRLGLALLDREAPDHCLLRGDSWIFGPEAPYERDGDVGNVAFPCGYTLGADGDTIHLY